MRTRMKPTTRRRLLLGVIVAALLYIGLSVAFGDRIRPLHNALGEAFRDFGLLIGEGVVRSVLWIAEFGGPQVLVLLGVAWALREIIPVARRNRHKLPSMPAINGRRVGAISGISLGALAVVVGLSFGSVALADHGRPMANSAYTSSEAWVNRQLDNAPWNDKDETKAAPASSAAPTGDTRTETPGNTTSTAPAQPEDETTEEPRNTEEPTTGDNRTETSADNRTVKDDKPVTDALSGVLTDADRIVNDPVKFADNEPLRAGIWAFALLVVLLWLVRRPFVWRRNAVLGRQVIFLRDQIGAEDEDDSVLNKLAIQRRNSQDDYAAIEALKTDVAALKRRSGGSSDTRVAGSPTA